MRTIPTALWWIFGLGRLFILSAGWGLIPASFLTPGYDITFATSADDWKRRRKADRYQDFCMLPDDDDPIAFVGGKDYLPLFRKLTTSLRVRKVVLSGRLYEVEAWVAGGRSLIVPKEVRKTPLRVATVRTRPVRFN